MGKINGASHGMRNEMYLSKEVALELSLYTYNKLILICFLRLFFLAFTTSFLFLGMVQMRRFVLDSLVRERKRCKEAPSEDMVKEKETQPVLAGRNRCISLIVAQ